MTKVNERTERREEQDDLYLDSLNLICCSCSVFQNLELSSGGVCIMCGGELRPFE